MNNETKKIILVVKALKNDDNNLIGWQAVRKDNGRQMYACYSKDSEEIDKATSKLIRDHVEKYSITKRSEDNNHYKLVSYTNVETPLIEL